MSFLPEGYEVPKTTGNYTKLQPGTNKLRFLASPVIGYEWWEDSDEGRKPRRVKTFQQAVNQGAEPIKHFWALPVWNYQTERLEIFEITQKGIMGAIETLVSDEDWGTPLDYDLKITKSGEGMETKYQVSPSPKKSVESHIAQAYKDTKIDLQALFRNENPFQASDEFDSDTVADDVMENLK